MDSMDSMKPCRQCCCRRPATQNICPCPVIQIVPNKSGSHAVTVPRHAGDQPDNAATVAGKTWRDFKRGKTSKFLKAHPAPNAHRLQLSSGSCQTMLSRIRWPSRSIHCSADPAGGHQHDHQEAPANGSHDNLSNRWPRQSDFCTAGRADVIHTRSLSLPWSR